MMADTTKISWCDHTWSPWLGCSPVHTGCLNCYAQAYFKRMGIVGKRRKTSEANWKKPLKWNRDAEGLPSCPRVFPSLCDPFEDWQGPIVDTKGERLFRTQTGEYLSRVLRDTPGWWATMTNLRREFFRLIDQTPNLDWLLLTKRPENIRRMWLGGHRKNVWLLYSASDQESLRRALDICSNAET